MSFCETLLEIIVRGGLTCLAWAFDVVAVNGGYYIGKIREEDSEWNLHLPRMRRFKTTSGSPGADNGPE